MMSSHGRLRLTAVIFSIVLGGMFASPLGTEEATAPGTVLSASTSATFQDTNGTSYSTVSNTVTTTVANAAALTVSTPTGQAITLGMIVVDTFTLTNTGNAAGTFALSGDATFAGTAASPTLDGYVLNAAATGTCSIASPCTYTTLNAQAGMGGIAINGTATVGVEYTVSTSTTTGQTVQTTLSANVTYATTGGASSATSSNVTATPTDTLTPDARLDIQETATTPTGGTSHITWTVTANNGGNFAARDSAAVGDAAANNYVPGVAAGIFFESQIPQFNSAYLALQANPTCALSGASSGATATVYYWSGTTWTSTPPAPLSNAEFVGCLIKGGTGGMELPSAPSASSGAGSVTTPQVTFTFVTAQPSGAGSTSPNAVTGVTEAWMDGQPWATGATPLLGVNIALGTADVTALGAYLPFQSTPGVGTQPPGGVSNMAGSQAPLVARLDIQETASTPTGSSSKITWTSTANNGGTYAASDSLAVKNLLGLSSGAVALVTKVPVFNSTALVLQSTPTCTLNGAASGAAATLYYSTNGTSWSTTYSSTSSWLACGIAGGTGGVELPSNPQGSSGAGAVTSAQATFTFVTAQPSGSGSTAANAVTDVVNAFMAGTFGGTGVSTTIGPSIAQGTTDATSVSLTTAEANTTPSVGTVYPGGASNTSGSQAYVSPGAPRMDIQATASQPSSSGANITWTVTGNNGGSATAYSTKAAKAVFGTTDTAVAVIIKIPTFGGAALALQSTPTCTDTLSFTCTLYYGQSSGFPGNYSSNGTCTTLWCTTYSASATWVAAVVQSTSTSDASMFTSAPTGSAGAGIVTTAQVTLTVVTAQPSGTNASYSDAVTAFAGALISNSSSGNYLVGPGILASSSTADTATAATANTDLALIASQTAVSTGSISVPGGVSNAAGSQAYVVSTNATGIGTAVYVGSDSTTQGAWHASSSPWTPYAYGSDGYTILDGTSGNTTLGTHNPSYATVTLGGSFNTNVFAASGTTDTRAPYQSSTSATRIANQDQCFGNCAPFSGAPFTIDVNITDGGTHQFSIYLLEWDANSVQEAILVTDVTHGTNLLMHGFSNFNNGAAGPLGAGQGTSGPALPAATGPIYVRWNISGHVRFTFYSATSDSDAATFSAYFFDPVTRSAVTSSNSASYVSTDTLTQGNWTPGYGGDGYSMEPSTALPSYASYLWYGGSAANWTSSTTDVRGQLNGPGLTTRSATTWYNETFGVELLTSAAHVVDMYFLDWDNLGRKQMIYVSDPATGTIFDARQLSGYRNGTHIAWNMTGSVLWYFVENDGTGQNGICAGIFFGKPVPSLTFVDAVSPTGNQPPGTVLTYTGTLSNVGALSALSNYVTTAIPANTDFQIGSPTATLTNTGLTYAVTYSNNSGSTYAYTPVSAGGGAASGYDRNVTNVKWTFTGNLSQGAGANTGTVSMAVQIR